MTVGGDKEVYSGVPSLPRCGFIKLLKKTKHKASISINQILETHCDDFFHQKLNLTLSFPWCHPEPFSMSANVGDSFSLGTPGEQLGELFQTNKHFKC